MARKWKGINDDRYISPWDGHISKLLVQCTDEIYGAAGNTTYRRTYIRNVSTKMLRLANWPTKHFDWVAGRYKYGGTGLLVAKWIPACIALTVMILFAGDGAQERKVARNVLENPTTAEWSSNEAMAQLINVNPTSERILHPRYLCFLDEKSPSGIVHVYVEDWLTSSGEKSVLRYMVVAYTAEQFNSDDDMTELHEIAKTATKAAGLPAYWIGCSCMPDNDQIEDDVFRISDVIRGASAVCIAVGQPDATRLEKENGLSSWQLLKQWGQRLWTFPEVLLAPAHTPILVYTRDSDLSNPIAVPKNQFAAHVWDDAQVSHQLVDHFEGNLVLSRLELVTIALRCLYSRQTTQYLPRYHAHVLMSLLRLRPKADHTDSAFQAFARLSLANDSDMLLERLICTLPKSTDQPWSSMDDAWNIAGIGEDDTVIIDGCRGAAIRWKSFAPVKNLRRTSWKRLGAQLALHSAGSVWFISIALMALPDTLVPGVLFFIYSTVMIGAAPYLLRLMYSGKFWYTQPWFFGFEGYLDIETIESQIFGARLGRLQWSAWGSPLSRHHRNEHGECIGDDPTADPEVIEKVMRARSVVPGLHPHRHLHHGGDPFEAARPPVGMILCGSEGGMQRAVGVSYDWTSGTCYRETVFRLETPVIDNMSRIPRTKLGLKRPDLPVRAAGEKAMV
ncbi:hypothetical protein H2203_003612 [Taxawa tesnikishii (nom. ined.)]|nr:hypothetical protein H2203_003612 [Dothideales sp. JES 119]